MVKEVFFFFHLTYVKPKHQAINISKQVQMIFNACFGYIGYVGYVWYNVVCSQLMSQFDGYQLQLVYPTVAHHPVRSLQQGTSRTFDMFSQSQHFLHASHKSSFFFFAFQLHFYLS